MVRDVMENSAAWDEEPYKFEAGTPNVSGAVGLARAIEYIGEVGFENIRAVDEELTRFFLRELGQVKGAHTYGPSDPSKRGSVVSFTLEGIHPVGSKAFRGVHPHDLATILDRDHVCIRAGHHCAIPLMRWLGVSGTARASFWLYNTKEDVEMLLGGIEKASKILRK